MESRPVSFSTPTNRHVPTADRLPVDTFRHGAQVPWASCPWYCASVLAMLSVPADNDRGPQYAEHVLAAIHQANPRRLPMEIGFARHRKTVTLLCRCPPELAGIVASQLAAHYPAATISRLPNDALTPPKGFSTWSAEMRLTPDLFPIRRYSAIRRPAQPQRLRSLDGDFRGTCFSYTRPTPILDHSHRATCLPPSHPTVAGGRPPPYVAFLSVPPDDCPPLCAGLH